MIRPKQFFAESVEVVAVHTGRSQENPFLALDKPFHGKLALQGGDDNAFAFGWNGAINHKKIAVHDSRVDHGLAVRPRKKGCGLVLDKMLV